MVNNATSFAKHNPSGAPNVKDGNMRVQYYDALMYMRRMHHNYVKKLCSCPMQSNQMLYNTNKTTYVSTFQCIWKLKT